MRKDMTYPEQKLWKKIRSNQMNVKFRRQHPIGNYIADFYCRDCGLVIEVDGEQHCSPDSLEYDYNRDEFMKSIGLEVLRFSNSEINSNFKDVLSQIYMTTR